MYSYNNLNEFMSNVKNIQFPYKRLYYSDSEIKTMFKKLQNINFSDRIFHEYYKIHNLKFPSKQLIFLGRPHIIKNKESDYKNFDIISDMFQEKNRMDCKFFSAISSPNEFYNKNIKLLASQILSKNKKITPHTLRETLYSNVKECSSFKSSLMLYVIKLFNVKSVLDPCSGWGDRLVAAMAADVRYVGVDPNKLLHPVYQEMISFFVSKNNQKKYKMIENTIQEAILPNQKFDLVFTSPPYFKIEQYSNRGRIIENNEVEWFENFMKPMIDKTYEKLKYGGRLVIVINQLPHEHYIQSMIEYIHDKIYDLHYLGVIGYSNTTKSNPQPMWIWQKDKQVPEILYNPPIIITDHKYNNISFKVFRDDNLIGGTKQRAMVSTLNKIDKEKIIYAGPTSGLAQVAIAYSAKLLHKTAVLFLNKLKNKQSDLTKLALSFNSVELHEIENGHLNKLIDCAKKYNKKNKNSYMISLGGNEPTYIKELIKNIKKSLPKSINPIRIWIVAGSATILNVLYKIFPKTHFMVVQVGKTIWPDQLKNKRTTLFISNEKFYDEALLQPPFPTVKTYDAKLWVFFIKHGKNGDYIWNVGKD